MANNYKQMLTVLFGAVMILAGIAHFVKTHKYLPIVPAFLPKKAIIYGSGILEMVLGIGVFIPRFRPLATLGILLLMVAFLPLHITDVFKDKPAIGSNKLALVRLPLQFLLIWWAWFIYKK